MLVALSLTALMTVVALGMDLSVIFNWRRTDQNAADHAALAAAWASCHGNDPIAAGHASAQANGFNDDGTTNTVAVDEVGPHTFEVVITSSVDVLFAGIIGVDSLDAMANAVGTCSREQSGSFAIFAGSETCGEKTLDWSGSGSAVTGRVHSNDGFYVGGTSNSVEGAATYVSDVFVSNGNDIDPPPGLSGTLPYPVEFDVADYALGGARASLAGSNYHYAGSSRIDLGWLRSNGLFDASTGTLATGLYFTTSDIDISASNVNGTVTLVTSGGTISINGSTQNLTPWDPEDLLLFSDRDTACFDFATKMDGSNSTWRGIVYAPRGLIEMSGSTNSTLFGSLIGDTVRLNGSSLSINAQDGCCAGPPTISLLE